MWTIHKAKLDHVKSGHLRQTTHGEFAHHKSKQHHGKSAHLDQTLPKNNGICAHYKPYNTDEQALLHAIH